MRILLAPDSYKGSLDAPAAAQALARGLARVWPGADLDVCPLSDGGEGFLAALGGTLSQAATTTAVGEPVTATYARLGDTVAIELSSAAGLVQVPLAQRDPLLTTTWGVGQLIAAAWAERPFRKLVLALGGSATVDGGAGLLIALGARLLDADRAPIPLGGGGLARLATADFSGLSPALREAEVLLAVDVTNPLLGRRGAAPVYGPQKGADPAAVLTLEAALTRWADVLQASTGVRIHDLSGGGSCGGVPAGLVAAVGARCEPGFELAAAAVNLDQRLVGCDLVVTGEGMLDEASFEGKVVGRLAARCQAAGVPLVAVVGRITDPGEARLAALGGAALSLVPGPLSLDAACANAEALLEAAGARLARLRG